MGWWYMRVMDGARSQSRLDMYNTFLHIYAKVYGSLVGAAALLHALLGKGWLAVGIWAVRKLRRLLKFVKVTSHLKVVPCQDEPRYAHLVDVSDLVVPHSGMIDHDFQIANVCHAYFFGRREHVRQDTTPVLVRRLAAQALAVQTY